MGSINGEMGAEGRGKTATPVERYATGAPSGGEWIEITAQNLPPHDDLLKLMASGNFRIYFGRLFDHENNGNTDINAATFNYPDFGAGGKGNDGGSFLKNGDIIDGIMVTDF